MELGAGSSAPESRVHAHQDPHPPQKQSQCPAGASPQPTLNLLKQERRHWDGSWLNTPDCVAGRWQSQNLESFWPAACTLPQLGPGSLFKISNFQRWSFFSFPSEYVDFRQTLDTSYLSMWFGDSQNKKKKRKFSKYKFCNYRVKKKI